jgi:hypothetical protein
MNLPQVIALVGNAGAGKSTVADYMISAYGYHRVKFAGPLKNMLRAIGLDNEEIEGSKKEQPCDLLCGKTPRHAMVTLGTEWGRDLIGQDFWTGLWEEEVCAHLNSGLRVVVDDCRFPNELAAVKRRGGVAWRIVRPSHEGSSLPGHRSEGALSEFYGDMRAIANSGWVEDLHAKVKQIMDAAALAEHAAREEDARLIAESNRGAA